MIRWTKLSLLLIPLLLVVPDALQAGGWLERAVRGTYRGVKNAGQELIEKPVRRLKGEKTPPQAVERTVSPPRGGEPVSIPRPVEDLSLDRPYDGKVTDYNRSSKIESILGMLELSGELPEPVDRAAQKAQLQSLDNRRLGQVYAGVLTLSEGQLVDQLAASVLADRRAGIRLSGGFASYPGDAMRLHKVRAFFHADEDGRLFLSPSAPFPAEARSLWLQRRERPLTRRLAETAEIDLVRSRGLDGWLFTVDDVGHRLGVSWFDGRGQRLDCGVFALSADRRRGGQ